MRPRKKLVLLIGTAAAFVLVLFLWPAPEPQSVAEHLRMYESYRRLRGPTGLQNLLSRNVLEWIGRGFPSHEQVAKAMRRHEDALVKLGYLERRSFALPVSVNGTGPQYPIRFPRTFITNAWSMEVFSMEAFSERGLARFTARPSDMKVIESLIREWAKADSEANSGNEPL